MRTLLQIAKLTQVELRIFLREPMGAFGSIAVPVLLFLVVGKLAWGESPLPAEMSAKLGAGLPIFATILIALSNVLSLVAVISIYRDGGILKRLRATPLRPQTILTAHVVVKLVLTAVTLFLLVVAGKQFAVDGLEVRPLSFAVAMAISMVSILSVGFVIASIVPTARFAQPVGAVIFYPMLAFSGLFFPLSELPQSLYVVANLLPLTHAVALLEGIWTGGAWADHQLNVLALGINLVVCIAVSGKIFRWE